MKIIIVGAGISGLVALKYALEEGHEVICFEKTANLGGCWSGDGSIGNDQYGNPIVSGMYQDLRTNLPKEIMTFNGLDHKPIDKSFVSQADILDYIQTYARKFNLPQNINFGHKVLEIRPLSNDRFTRWELNIENMTVTPSQKLKYDCDVVLIASGHFIYKSIAQIDGAHEFKGFTLHSNDYRNSEEYKNRRVLVIGAGPSGCDIAKKVSFQASVTFQSVKPKSERFIPIYEGVIKKPEVQRFDANGAHFKDGSYEALDVIIYSTGYIYKMPFLNEQCGIRVDNNWFKYLYHHCVNIERPSMAIIGLPYGASLFPLVDLQARYYMAYLAKKFELPSREDMLKSVQAEHEFRKSKGIPDRLFHGFPDSGRALSTAMATESGVKNTATVIFNIMDSLHAKWNDTDTFEIVDEEKFIRKTKN